MLKHITVTLAISVSALQFTPGIKKLYAEIQINYDNERENSEVFSVHLSQDRFMIAEVKV